MKITPPDPGLLSLNTATVRERWSLREVIEGCARHGIRGISPWRDKLAALGVKEAAKMIRNYGLTVTGLCRAGMFPAADRKGRQAALDDNLRAIEDAADVIFLNELLGVDFTGLHVPSTNLFLCR